MTGAIDLETIPRVIEAGETGETMELVRGREQKFLERLAPMVRQESVSLDLDSVERIDAAGLAALITLYCDACKAGHKFTVKRPRRHVRELLKVVGLDQILLAREEGAVQLEQSAA